MPRWIMDNWFNISAVLVAVISMFGLHNLMRKFNGLERLSKSRIEYRQAKELIHLIEQAEHQDAKPHAYLIEKGYGAVSGTNKLDSEEIIYCLGMKSPNRALRYYTAIIAAVILWVPTQVDFKNSYYSFIFLAIISFPFIGLSFIYLSEASNLSFAEKFMKLQAKTFKESEFETLIANEPETKEPEREN